MYSVECTSVSEFSPNRLAVWPWD